MATYIEKASDYNVRYEGCYGVLNGKVIQALCFNDNSYGVRMSYVEITPSFYNETDDLILEGTPNFKEKTLNKVPFNTDMFPLPKLGFINLKTHTVFIERLHTKPSPARYRRGLRRDTLSVALLSIEELVALNTHRALLNSYATHMGFQIIAPSLFFPKFPSYKGAVEAILSGKKLSVAIAPTIAIKADYKNSSVVLYKNRWPIGDLSSDNTHFILRTPFFNSSLDECGVKYK